MAEVQNLNLIQKLEKIRKLAEVVQKDASGYGYTYASITTILANVKAGMNKYHVVLVPMMKPHTQNVILDRFVETKQRKDGTDYEKVSYEYRVDSQMIYRWIDADNPEDVLDVPWFIVGSQKDPSQAMGSALTYSERYFLTQFFQIATPEEDPDFWRSKKKEAEEEEGREVAQAIVNEIHKFVTDHVEKYPDDKETIVKITKKYVREGKKPSANYFSLKNPEVATELFAAIKDGVKKQEAKPKKEAKETKSE